MAYFTSYFTDYFDVEAAQAEVVEERGGGYWVSREEWLSYLRRLNEAQIERIAARAAERSNLREMLREQMFPKDDETIVIERTPETKIEPVKSPKYRIRRVKKPEFPLADMELRLLIAEKMLAIRKRMKKIKKRRQEDSIIFLLFG